VTISKGRGSDVATPELPSLTIEVVRERIAHRDGFLHVRRLDLAIVREGGARSATFGYDVLDRRALDASVIVAHHAGPDGLPHVWLRSCVRPPVALRTAPGTGGSGVLWEVPAGLIEPGESPASAAARELAEELGFTVAEAALAPLGTWTMPAPAFIGEVHHFFHARVDPMSRGEPAGDGSPLEDAPVIFALPLESALAACRRGEIRDAKTELALRRLQDVLS
jgi:ADP-ribose pyrophosphatase